MKAQLIGMKGKAHSKKTSSDLIPVESSMTGDSRVTISDHVIHYDAAFK